MGACEAQDYEFHEATGSRIAAEALRRIAELYAIEEGIRSQPALHRRQVRLREARPLVTALKAWLEQELGRIPPGGTLAEAIRYALARWPALGRKNHLFAGSDGGGHRWAVVCSLIASAKLNDVEPYAYLKDVLERMAAGHPANRLDELLPWNWRQAVLSTTI